MADFIAVIRRAVDGLSDNTPELRARVYEKARAAVERQLENMKPRPPEEMLRRQLNKLEQAIIQVEEEHAEALPAVEDDIFPPAQSPEPDIPEASAATDTSAFDPPQAATVQFSTVDEVVSPPESESILPIRPNAQIEAYVPVSVVNTAEQTRVEEMADPLAAFIRPMPAAIAEPIPAVAQESPVDWPVEVDSEPETWVEPEPETGPVILPERPVEAAILASPAEPVSSIDNRISAAADDAAIRMPKASFDETRALADFGDLLEPPVPVVVAKPASPDFSWDAPFDDLPELAKPQVPVAVETPLQSNDQYGTRQREIAAAPVPAMPANSGPATPVSMPEPVAANRDPLAELDDLIGFTRSKGSKPPPATPKGPEIPADVSRAVSKLEGRSFRTQPRQNKRGVAVFAFAAVIVAIFGGGALALWLNYDKIVAMIDGTPAVTSAEDPAADSTATGTKTAEEKQASTGDVEIAAEPDTTAAEGALTETALAAPEKFTQRLSADGTEVAAADPVQIDAGLPEGKTITEQTIASQPDPNAAVTGVTPDVPVVAAGDPVQTTPDAANPALGIVQKMFLYEERIGQGTPAAVTGTVAWSVKNETSDGGKAEPVIEAVIDAPERGIKVLVTFKRNTDASLPASHLIELVFQLPKDFEGGNIESVDRIALKPTEQNIGNPLIGVPAKITDDFHMIALNDDKDAIANNLELLKSRPWIDIPITYRNGRKALITIEKGTSGTAAFEKALGEWAALGKVTAN